MTRTTSPPHPCISRGLCLPIAMRLRVCTCGRLALVAVLVMAACHPSSGLISPNTSMATLPVGYFGGLSVHPRPQANLEMLAKLRVVMIEKWEGHCWADCVSNTSAGVPCQPSCHAEAEMKATIRALKSLNPAVAVGYYQNSLYDWTMQQMNLEFSAIDGNMRDSKGQIIGIRQDNGLEDQQIFALNQPAVVDLYLSLQQSLAQLGFIDGSYLDKPTDFPIYDKQRGSWTICELPTGSGHHPFEQACALITAEQADNYTRGKRLLLGEVRQIWAPKGGFVMGIANATMQVLHCNPKAPDSIFHTRVEAMNATVRQYLSQPGVDSVYICVGDQLWTHDPADTTGLCDTSIVAKAMMFLEPGVILGCNGWRPEFASLLGNPLGPAILVEDVWTRHFASGTYAKFHVRTGVGRIFWASDGAVQ